MNNIDKRTLCEASVRAGSGVSIHARHQAKNVDAIWQKLIPTSNADI